MRYVNGHIRGWKTGNESLAALLDYSNTSTHEHVLPPGCKHFQRSGDFVGFVIEEQPTVRRLQWQLSSSSPESRRKEGKYQQLRLSLPYVVHYLLFCGAKFYNSWVFFGNEPLKDINQYMGRAALYNCESSGKMCLGVDINAAYPKECDPRQPNNKNLTQDQQIVRMRMARIRHYFSTFWGTSFNFDMPSANFTDMRDRKQLPFADVLDWAAKTEENPEFILSHNWISTGLTLSNLMAGNFAVRADFSQLYRHVLNVGTRGTGKNDSERKFCEVRDEDNY
jgi:hypothetical protein